MMQTADTPIAAAPPPRMHLPRLGLGCSRMGSFNNPQTLAQSRALVRLAMDLEVTLFDTANIYGQGDSERVLGQALRGMREQATIVTKAGQAFSPRMRLLRPFKPLLRPLLARSRAGNPVTAQREAAMRTVWSAGALVESLAGSLRRLRTDHVDVFLLHSPSAAVLREGDAADALVRAHERGMARAVGIACDDMAALRAALSIPQVTVLELPWDVLDSIRDDALATDIRSRGIAVIAREVLRLQPGVDAIAAIEKSVALPFVTTTLVGTRRDDRLRAIAGRFASWPGPGQQA